MQEISLKDSAPGDRESEVEQVVLKCLLDESVEARGTVANASKQHYSAVEGELF